jgi:multidrug efflux pump subunit AcrA (membrane-fusion protein)
MLKRSVFILVVIALVSAGGYYVWGRLQETVKVDPPQLVAVKKEIFIHEILERGSVDSARNEEIRCMVESAGGLSITFVVDEGMLVKKGDRLVELDSSTLRENVLKQHIAVIASKAKLERSKSDLITAELNLQEYEEGTYIQNLKTIENESFSAQESVHTQEDNLTHYKQKKKKNYITDSKVAADLIELEKAENALEIAALKRKVLQEISYKKMMNLYQALVDSNKATVEADEETLKLDTARLAHLEEQQRRCTINAPRDGQVVYYMPRWGGDEDLIRVSKKVYERQILLQLPDPTQMQVKGLVNEANIRLVKPGQKAAIRLEAFPNQIFEGVVKTVNDYPEPGNFMGGSMSKEYMTIVTILDEPNGIKTGLTAEARILVNEIPNVLLLPAQAVFEYGGTMYAATCKEGKWDKIEVKTGSANDKEVVILEGLNEGDEVVLGAWTHRDKLNLPKLEAKPDESGEEEIDGEMLREQMRRESGQQGGGVPRTSPPSGGGGGRGGGNPRP